MVGTNALLRRLGPDEWPLLRSVRLTALADAPSAFGSTLARETAFTDDVWRSRTQTGVRFVAELDGTVVGMVTGIHQEGTPTHERQVVGLWVAPAARGQGIASLLIRCVADWAEAEEGATELTLGVAADNEAAYRLYERLGFRSTGTTHPLPSAPARCETELTRPLPWR